jgi:hypothetical protein
MKLIPFSPSSLICGDFNSHHPVWDNIQPEDERGTELLEWASTNDLSILNDSSVTRHSRSTGNGSSPDVSLSGKTWRDKCAWAVDDEEIGGSNHLPIVITVHTSIKHQPIMDTAPCWRSNGIHWPDFCAEEQNHSQCNTLLLTKAACTSLQGCHHRSRAQACAEGQTRQTNHLLDDP